MNFMNFIARTIQQEVENSLFKGKIVIIYGARQVGKTTLIKQIQEKHSEISVYLDCDEPDVRKAFTEATSTAMKAFIGNKKLVFIDEAQRVKNVGLSLKLLADNFPEMQIVATGSSSFDLSNQIAEPLTGRKYEFLVYPFSWEELHDVNGKTEMSRLLEYRILYGMYPEITQKGQEDAQKLLKSVVNSYLYKDVLQYQNIKNPEVLEKLLQALALQIGNEVSYNELAQTVGVEKRTVASYIQILEKAFIIFRVGPFSRNLRTELKKLRKIYFLDTGVRNALLNNFNHFSLRQDTGALWENFLISERLKLNNNHFIDKNIYFWRTHNKKEIDYLEEFGGQINAFEFKWQEDKVKPPVEFTAAYPQANFQVINRNNYWDFLMCEDFK